MPTIRLSWLAVENAASYNIYYSTSPGLSIRFTPLLTNTAMLSFDHNPGLGDFYYMIAPKGSNNELGPTSNEIHISTGTLASITISPANMSIVHGNTQQYTATGHFGSNPTLNLTNDVTWSVGVDGYTTITSGGLLTAVSAGSTTITATLNAVNGSTGVTIT